MFRVAYFVVPYIESRQVRGGTRIARFELAIERFTKQIHQDNGHWTESRIGGLTEAVVKVRVEDARLLDTLKAQGWEELTRAQASARIRDNPRLRHHYDRDQDVVVIESEVAPLPSRTIPDMDKEVPSVPPVRGGANPGDFPTMPLLDDFGRASVGTLDGDEMELSGVGTGEFWETPSNIWTNDNGGEVTVSGVSHSTGSWGGWVTANSYDRLAGGKDGVEAYIKLGVKSNISRVWWATTPAVSPTGYYFEIAANGVTGKIVNVTSGSEVTVGASFTVASIDDGDSMGIWHDNDGSGTIYIFTRQGTDPWGQETTRTDTDHQTGGIGIEQNDGSSSTFDEIGGGEVAAAGPSTQTLNATLIAHTPVIYAATISPVAVDANATLISESETLYAATIKGANLLTATLISETEVLYAAAIENSLQEVTATLIPESETLLVATLSPGPVPLNATLISESETLYPALIVDAGAPTLDLFATLIARSEVLYAATLTVVAADQQLNATLISETEVLYAAVAKGVVDANATLISETEVLYAATLEYVLLATIIAQTEILYAAAIRGVVDANATLIARSEVLYAAAISLEGAVQWIQHQDTDQTIDSSDYRTGTVFAFQAQIATDSPSTPAFARLYNVTLGAEVAGTVIFTGNAALTMQRSITFTLPAGDNEYIGQFGGVPGGEYSCDLTEIIPVEAPDVP